MRFQYSNFAWALGREKKLFSGKPFNTPIAGPPGLEFEGALGKELANFREEKGSISAWLTGARPKGHLRPLADGGANLDTGQHRENPPGDANTPPAVIGSTRFFKKVRRTGPRAGGGRRPQQPAFALSFLYPAIFWAGAGGPSPQWTGSILRRGRGDPMGSPETQALAGTPRARFLRVVVASTSQKTQGRRPPAIQVRPHSWRDRLRPNSIRSAGGTGTQVHGGFLCRKGGGGGSKSGSGYG